KDERGCAASQGRFYNSTRIDSSPVNRAYFEFLDTLPEQAVAGIKVADVKDLMWKRTNPRSPKSVEGIRLPQALALLSALLQVQVRGFTDDPQRDRCHTANTVDLLKFLKRGLENAPKGLEAIDKRRRWLFHV